MSDFIEEATAISARFQRDLVLITLAQEWERESWDTEELAESSETIRLLNVYRDRAEKTLADLDFQIRQLIEHLMNNARNP